MFDGQPVDIRYYLAVIFYITKRAPKGSKLAEEFFGALNRELAQTIDRASSNYKLS